MKDHINLIRIRVALLLSSGLVNVTFIFLLCVLVAHFHGVNTLVDRLAINVAEEADVGEYGNKYGNEYV